MQRGVESRLHVSRQSNGLRARIDLNGLAGLIDNHGAVFAVLEVALQLLLQSGIEFSVDIVRYFADDVFAVQLGPPSRK